MKKYHLIMIAAFFITSCKTRKVSIEKQSSIDRSIITQVVKNNILQTDTTKTLLHTISTRSTNDNLVVSITPDTGNIQIIQGNYIGKARNVVIKRASTAIKSTDDLIQQNKGEITQTIVNDSVIQKNNIKTEIKAKQITTAGGIPWWLWIAGALVLLTSGFLIIKKLV
jgi:hypothetical protein